MLPETRNPVRPLELSNVSAYVNGDGNGKVSLKELKKYLNETMTYYARRYYGRTQTAQMIVNGRELSVSN